MASTAHSTRTAGTPYVPTDQARKTVIAMTAFGIPQNAICGVLDITVPTLHKFFRTEIDTAVPEANARIANTLFQKALSGDNVCMIFWLKCRALWRTTDKLIVTDGDDAEDFDATALTDADLAARILQLRRAAAARRNPAEAGVPEEPGSVVH